MAKQLCYNRGCGKEFFIRENGEDACKYHPGAPYFHDAYKGWTCCQNKSTDFTTFLNTPGCSLGKHSNVKPLEPEKITGNLTKEDSPEVEVVVRPPIQPAMPRPSVETCLMTRLQPTVASSARQAVASLQTKQEESGEGDSVKEGESCKNNGCKVTFSEEVAFSECKYHPGVPVFHEGMKYWSCCQRKTSEFQHFLEQEGCELGKHKWRADKKGTEVTCRYDWHQTATHMTVAVYAKKYDPDISFVEVGPVRLVVNLKFPADNSSFGLDLELKGVVAVEGGGCTASMFGTKLEVKMKKAESGSWAKLDIPRPKVVNKVDAKVEQEEMSNTRDKVDALELDDLDLAPTKYQLSKEAQTPAKY